MKHPLTATVLATLLMGFASIAIASPLVSEWWLPTPDAKA